MIPTERSYFRCDPSEYLRFKVPLRSRVEGWEFHRLAVTLRPKPAVQVLIEMSHITGCLFQPTLKAPWLPNQKSYLIMPLHGAVVVS